MTPMLRKAPVAIVATLLVSAVMAKVPVEQAERLGKDLTCTGAIKAGNKEGTIPAFTGKWKGAPPSVKHEHASGEHPVDIYADEKPLFSITAENMEQYAEKLSPGQQAMLKKYAGTYRIPVYTGHRDFSYTDEVCALIKKNALESEVGEDGLSLKKGYLGAMNFPIPAMDWKCCGTTCSQHVRLLSTCYVITPMSCRMVLFPMVARKTIT